MGYGLQNLWNGVHPSDLDPYTSMSIDEKHVCSLEAKTGKSRKYSHTTTEIYPVKF